MKKNLKAVISLVICVSMLFGTMVPVQAAKKKPWKNAYAKILDNWRSVESYTDETEYLKQYFGDDYKFNRYFLCDVDKNGTPELFLHSTTMGLTMVFTYRSGKVRYLMCNDFYKINTKKHTLLVKGHWHGAGGSGKNEYSAYTIKKGKISKSYYFDKGMNGYYISNLKNYKQIGNTKSVYQKYYKKYVSGGKKFSEYKKYKLSNRKALR